MIIDCISDLHGYKPKLQGGDLLIVAGDCTARDIIPQWKEFFDWFKAQDYRKKVLVGGNHDGFLEACATTKECREIYNELCESDQEFIFGDNERFEFLHEGFEYLEDTGTEFEGFKIWGAPWTPEFCGWHFMLPRGDALKEKWDLIPDDTDILITHGPPYGVLDEVLNSGTRKANQGCFALREAVERVRPKLHVFGHIHEGYGKLLYKHEGPNTWCVNCAIMDRYYQPVNKPIRMEL